MRIITVGIVSVLLAAWASQAQPATTYTSAELKKEQVMFTGYLDDAEKQLDGAKRRLDNNNCELAVASVILALGNKDLSKFKQYGHLDRIQSNSAGWVSTARKLTAKYNDEVVPKTQKTEEDIDQFIKAYFAKICPDLLRLIDSYKNMVKQLDPNDPNSAKKISDIMGTAEMGQGAQAIQEKINKTSGTTDHLLTSGSDTQSMLNAVQNLDLPQATKDALADAIQHGNWLKALDLLKDCNTPECQKLREQIIAMLKADLTKWGVPPDKIEEIIRHIRDGDLPGAIALIQPYHPDPYQYHPGPTPNPNPGPNPGPNPNPPPNPHPNPPPGGYQKHSDWSDFDGKGERHRATAYYPQPDASLTKEIVETQNRANDKIPDKNLSWGLNIKAGAAASSYSVVNEEDNDETFKITEWKLLKDGATVSSGTETSFPVKFTESGNYTIEAHGHTEPYNFDFVVRKVVPYNKDQ